MTQKQLAEHILSLYGVRPDHPFPRDDVSCVFRHSDSRKWFAITMNVPSERLGLDKAGSVDIVNLKCDPLLGGSLRGRDGFLPAYHMNKEKWITVLLDGSVPDEDVIAVLALSHDLTGGAAARRK